MSDIVEIMARAICIDVGELPDSIDGGLIMRGREGVRPNCEGYESTARAALTALEEKGYVVVKKVPTEEMLVALDNTPDKEWRTGTDHEYWTDLWNIMLAASQPSPLAAPAGEEEL